MEIRDAVEADAERLANLTGAPTDVMRNLIHDRTVRVAHSGSDGGSVDRRDAAGSDDGSPADGSPDDGADDATADPGPAEEAPGADAASGDDGVADGDPADVAAFVSFDAQGSTVHVTQLEGDPELCARLLAEPRRFAEREGMDVELLVAEDEETARTAAEAASFEATGSGPRFGGTATTRYRWRPDG